jgi:hypothetical protein
MPNSRWKRPLPDHRRRFRRTAAERPHFKTVTVRDRPLPDIGDFLIKGPVHFTHRPLAAFNAGISALREQSFARTLAAWRPSGSFLPTPPRAIDPDVRTQTTRRRQCYAPPRRRNGRPLAWRLRCPVSCRSLSVLDHSRPNSESRLSPPRATNGPHSWLDSRCFTYGMSAAGSPRQGYRCKFRWLRWRVPAIPVPLVGCSTLLLERVLNCALDSPEILHLYIGKRVAHA